MNTVTDGIVTLFWGLRHSPWSFKNDISVPKNYVEIDTCGLVDEDSKNITSYASQYCDVFLNLMKIEEKQIPQCVYVHPDFEKKILKKILNTKYKNGRCQRATGYVYGDRHGLGMDLSVENYENGELTNVDNYSPSDGDECWSIAESLGYDGEDKIEEGLSLDSGFVLEFSY